MVLTHVKDVLTNTLVDLGRRQLPVEDIYMLLADVESALSRREHNDGGLEPYFIPNDISLCAENTVLNCSHADIELSIPKGFAIQAAATRQTSFAKPYYIDPVQGVRRCKGLFANTIYADRWDWRWDLSFIGHKGKHDGGAHLEPLARTENTRFLFLKAFAADWLPSKALRVKYHTNDTFFFNQALTDSQREQLNADRGYVEAMCESKFVLCPRGEGPNSIRFFEALARTNIPIYVGEDVTMFPLDWIIDWDSIVFRISTGHVANGLWRNELDGILKTPMAEINRRRRMIFRVYHQFLAPETKAVFESLILLRARQLLRI